MTEDARVCIILRPGMIFKTIRAPADGDGAGDVFIVVANLKWGLLVWPMMALDAGMWQLRPASRLQWFFTTSCDQLEASDVVPVLTDLGLAVQATHWEHSAKAMLRSFSLDLTFGDLVFIGSLVGLENPKRHSRAELLRLLSMKFGDEEFARAVCSNEELQGKKKRTGDQCQDNDDDGFDSDDSLAEIVLDNMDGAEIDDFKELKKRVNNRHAQNKKRKWAQWRKDDEEDLSCAVYRLQSFVWKSSITILNNSSPPCKPELGCRSCQQCRAGNKEEKSC